MSDKRNHTMDDIFRKKLQGMEVEPAFHNWEMISEALPEEPSFYKRYAKELSIAAMMLLTLGTVMFWAVSNIGGSNAYGPVAYMQTDQNMYLDPYMASIYGIESSDASAIFPVGPNGVTNNTVLASTNAAPAEPIVIIKNVPATLPEGSVLVTAEEYSSLKGLMASVSELQSFYNKYKDIISNPFNNRTEYPELNNSNVELVATNVVPAVSAQDEIATLDNIGSDLISIDKKTKQIRSVGSDASYADAPNEILPISAFSEVDDRLSKLINTADYDYTPQNHHTSKLKGLFVGLGAGVHNSWILNKKAFKSGADVPEYVANYGTSYGVHIGYDFNSRFGVELDWILNSKQGQEFASIMGQGQPAMMSTIQMDYMHLPFLLKYKWSKLSSITHKPVVMSYGIGVQYSYLKAMNSSLSNEFILMSNVDRTHELGLALAFDYDFYISDRSFITLGGRSSYGTEASELRNALSSSSTKTNNLLLGLRAAYSRRLSR